MPVFRWGQSWDAFRDLEREVDRLLHSVNFSFPGLRLGRQYPLVNVYECEDEFLMTAELPGTRSEDLDLTVAGGILTLKGTRDDPPEVSDDRFRRHERFRGEWQRSLSIPDRVQEERMTAEFSNGILKIHLPKSEQSEPRQIPVVQGPE